MKKINICTVNESGYDLPRYATELSSGIDLRCCLHKNPMFKIAPQEGHVRLIETDLKPRILISPGGRVTVRTGIHIALPVGHEAQIRPRSGLAAKEGLVCVFGTIDADYRGEIGITLINTNSSKEVEIQCGERVAQMVICPVEKAVLIECSSLGETHRGDGGFGHSGKQ